MTEGSGEELGSLVEHFAVKSPRQVVLSNNLQVEPAQPNHFLVLAPLTYFEAPTMDTSTSSEDFGEDIASDRDF